MSPARLTVDELVATFYAVACRWNGRELNEDERRAWFEERRALAHLLPEEIEAWCATSRDALEASMWDALEDWNEEEHRRRASSAPTITIEPWRAPVRISRADAIAAGLPDPLHEARRAPVKPWTYIPVGPWR